MTFPNQVNTPAPQIAIGTGPKANIWCEVVDRFENGRIKFYAINGGWYGSFLNGVVTIDSPMAPEQSQRHEATIVWQGKAPFSVQKYAEALNWIDNEIAAGSTGFDVSTAQEAGDHATWFSFMANEIEALQKLLRGEQVDPELVAALQGRVEQYLAPESKDAELRALAAEVSFVREGECEIDDHAVVSSSDEGAYVMAWVWVDRPQSDSIEEDELDDVPL